MEAVRDRAKSAWEALARVAGLQRTSVTLTQWTLFSRELERSHDALQQKEQLGRLGVQPQVIPGAAAPRRLDELEGLDRLDQLVDHGGGYWCCCARIAGAMLEGATEEVIQAKGLDPGGVALVVVICQLSFFERLSTGGTAYSNVNCGNVVCGLSPMQN